MTREEMKKEAIKRMKKIGIYDETVNQFDRQNLISESRPPIGACFWLDDKQMERVKEFEETYQAVVYHVIHTYTEFGELENYLFVSNNDEEWEYEWNGLEEDMSYSYVQNLTYPHFSEFGSIGIQLTPAAGVRRIW